MIFCLFICICTSSVIFQCTSSQLKLDPDRVGALVLEVIPKHSCLVFCPTKKNCENVAELVCQFMSRFVDFVQTYSYGYVAFMKSQHFHLMYNKTNFTVYKQSL